MGKVLSCLAAVALAIGCGPVGDSGGNGGSSGGAGGAGGGAGGAGGGSGGAGGTGGSGGIDQNPDAINCGVQDFQLMRGGPPDLLIVLDRSTSMTNDPPSGGGTKWDQVTAALDQTVMSLQGQIEWGLEFFPTDDNCAVSTQVAVPVATGNYGAISGAIGGQSPGGNTPTRDAIHNGGAYLASVADANPKYLVVATDGEPNCAPDNGMCMCVPPFVMQGMQCCYMGFCVGCIPAGGGDDSQGAEQAVSDVTAMGVHTFVIGISTDSAADQVLNTMAQNGMEPRPGGPPYYYPVGSQSDFVNTINMIAGQIISCTFPLTMAPPYPDNVTITADQQPVPRDPSHMNGWDFGPGNMSITFYGGWCQTLQGGTVMDVHATFGCPPVGIATDEAAPFGAPASRR